MSANKSGNLTSSASHKTNKTTKVMSFNEYCARHQHLLIPNDRLENTNSSSTKLPSLKSISMESIASISCRSICSEPEQNSIDIISLKRAYSIDSLSEI
eukprot:UN09762